MGRRYVYAQATGRRAALEAAASAARLTVRVFETSEVIEILCDDGPSVKDWESNQVAPADYVGPIADAAPSALTVTVAASDWSTLTSAKSDTEILAAAKTLKGKV